MRGRIREFQTAPEHLLEDRYETYGSEFGPISRRRYLHLAQRWRDARTGRNILESRCPDGIIKFDLKHGYFGNFPAPDQVNGEE